MANRARTPSGVPGFCLVGPVLRPRSVCHLWTAIQDGGIILMLPQGFPMNTKSLVPVFSGTLQDQSVQLCNARELHRFLQIGKVFATWLSDRIKTYGFIENEDYLVFPKFGKNPKGGRPTIDYHLTLDMAKELAMVENNDQGRAVRRYLIRIEREARNILPDDKQIAADHQETLRRNMRHQRILLAFDHEGSMKATEVPADAFVVTGNQIAGVIEHFGVNKEALPDIILAAAKQLR